ncbi:MAG: hypothetical protein GKS05_03560 [Nitrospirales bacterium]|nr:hypothetical protein [Nitrospirales bacterium]
MESPLNNEAVAEAIRQQLGGTSAVTAIIAKDDLLQVHVTEELCRKLTTDRIRSRKIVLNLMTSMKRLTDLLEVTVRIYCNKEKFIEGKAKPYGGDNVAYTYDL